MVYQPPTRAAVRLLLLTDLPTDVTLSIVARCIPHSLVWLFATSVALRSAALAALERTKRALHLFTPHGALVPLHRRLLRAWTTRSAPCAIRNLRPHHWTVLVNEGHNAPVQWLLREGFGPTTRWQVATAAPRLTIRRGILLSAQLTDTNAGD